MDLPREIEKELKEILRGEYSLFQAAMGEEPHGGLRFNATKMKGDRCQELGCTKRVPWTENGYYTAASGLAKNPYYHGGLFYLQEPSAMAPAEILRPQKDEWVLDLCAAPGGKATRLSEFLAGSGFLVVNDISNSRCRGLLRNMELFGMKNAVVTNESPENLCAHFGAVFQRVLVDVPCSGQGMFRKYPSVLKDYRQRQNWDFPKLQRQILDSAAALTEAGGEIIYSTCTFSRGENEAVISSFLEAHAEFYLLDIPKSFGFSQGLDGLDETVRLWPHRLAGEGHFLAHLKKQGTKKEKSFPRDMIAASQESLDIFTHFLAENDIDYPQGFISQHRDGLYLNSEALPQCDGLKIVGRGVYLGQVKNRRFLPSQVWALSLKPEEVRNPLIYAPHSQEIGDYLKCLTLNKKMPKGYYLICAAEFPLGWVKSDGRGLLKNEYPKPWRNR